MFNHVDASWPFGVIEYQHIKRVQCFEYFCPGTRCSIPLSFSTDFTIHKLSSLLYTANSSHVSRGAGTLIKGCFAAVVVIKGRLHKALGPISARQLC